MATGALLCALSATDGFVQKLFRTEGTQMHPHAFACVVYNFFKYISEYRRVGCMRIFVTGATGFIGAHFVERALAEGHEVIGLYRSDGAKNREVIERLRDHGASLRHGNILKPESFADTLKGADVVCHFAAAFRESSA